MTDDIRASAEAALGYAFRDASLLAQALTHASVADSRADSNERLEFLGDSVLGLVTSRRVFHRFPDLLEGEMTKIKSTIVSRQTCAAIARQLGLDALMRIGKGMQGAGAVPQSLAAAVLEAVIAAIYLDGGLDAAETFILRHIDPLLEQTAQSGHQENFKSVLQQHAQQCLGDTPVYRILDEKGPDHAKCFKVCVEIASRRFPPSWGQSKKQAEQQAALLALRELSLVEDLPDGRIRVLAPPNPPPARNGKPAAPLPHADSPPDSPPAGPPAP